jgi:hypothetical protein
MPKGIATYIPAGCLSSVDGSLVVKRNLIFWRIGRVQSSVRPIDAVGKGLLALMESANLKDA